MASENAEFSVYEMPGPRLARLNAMDGRDDCPKPSSGPL